MNHRPYSAYRGRKGAARSILIAIVIVLALVLAAAVVGLFVLPNYIEYTAQGPRLVLPFFQQADPTGTPAPTPGTGTEPSAAPTGDPGLVIDPPSASPSPSPSVPEVGEVDLSGFERRDMPLGLVVAAGEGPREQDGYLFDHRVPAADPDREGSIELNRSLRYAAAYLDPPEPVSADDLVAWCLDDAARGYDEIIFSDALQLSGEDADPAALFRRVKQALDDGGWQGRLGLVLDQDLFSGEGSKELIPAIAQSFDRLYFRSTLKAANKDRLTDGGFTANGYTLVTVVQSPANLNYAWAVLPR